jgi:pyrroline-5-carboxylate reductase
MNRSIAIIGGGNLGTAIAKGLLKNKFCKAHDIIVTKRNTSTLHALKAIGIGVLNNNNAAVKKCDVIVLAVKPFQLHEVLKMIKKDLFSHHIIVSAVTGVTIGEIQKIIGKKIAIFRAMPNTAISIGESMTCLCNLQADEQAKKFILSLFSSLGRVVEIEEKLMEAATVLGACGTAFAMRYIRASIQGGIEIGFDAATASLIAAQTVKGAADLLLMGNTHPEQEIDKVTTPKGCTIAGLNEMEHRGFSSSLIRGVVTSYQKIAKE